MKHAAKSVPGVIDCHADHKQGTAEVTFDPSKTTPELIAKMISKKTGYKVTPPKNGKESSAKAEGPRSMKRLVFLTRNGCVNTAAMRANLDRALGDLGLPDDYQFLDADTLSGSDPRGGYGTPTVLYEERDLFGMTAPAVPHPSPT